MRSSLRVNAVSYTAKHSVDHLLTQLLSYLETRSMARKWTSGACKLTVYKCAWGYQILTSHYIVAWTCMQCWRAVCHTLLSHSTSQLFMQKCWRTRWTPFPTTSPVVSQSTCHVKTISSHCVHMHAYLHDPGQLFLVTSQTLSFSLHAECKDLLCCLLCSNPKERIKMADIMAHPWMNMGHSLLFGPAPFPNRLQLNDIIDQIVDHMVHVLKVRFCFLHCYS